MKQDTILVWLRNDLRLHDNEMLAKAAQRAANVIPVYCFDEQQFRLTTGGFGKTGAFRFKFLVEALGNMRKQMQAIGSDLVIRIGDPAQELLKVAQATQATALYAAKEVTAEETRAEQSVEKTLAAHGVATSFFWQSTLLHIEDLPFPMQALPDIFTQFRKQVERQVRVRKTFAAPQSLGECKIASGEIPSAARFGLPDVQPDKRAALTFVGGETAALARLNEYLWEKDLLRHYKETRNGLLGADYSSKFSPWLALGCISPRTIYEAVADYEAKRTKNESTYWLVFELLWRDYFRFVAKKFGKVLFLKGGIRNDEPPHDAQNRWFTRWVNGETGNPFIDANMRELKLTGFMSNRGRQNVASFLVKDLRVNWQLGAAYFESALIDYDVCSNWANWNYVAGIGNDPREDRYFNILSQAKRYDPKGEYVKHWLPELAHVPAAKIHSPDLLLPHEQRSARVVLGSDYPQAIVSSKKWLKEEAFGR